MNKQNKIIVGVIALILTLTIGYAVFTQSLNVKGTASAKGEFGLAFKSSDKNPNCNGYSKECITSNLYRLSEDGKTMTVTVENLTYPTAYVELPVVVKNIGTVDAVLKAVDVNVETGTDDVSVTYTGISANETLKANEQRDVVVRVEWKEASSNSTISAKFNVSLSYAQRAVVASSSSSGGSTGGDTGETEDWVYKVNPDGLITAYNYAHGTDVVVPAEVDGTPVKTINKESFLQASNGKLYISSDYSKYYILINEKEANYNTVRTKLINYFMSMCSSDDTECQENMKKNLYVCSDENTCYNVSEEESGTATKSALPSDAQLFSAVSVNTDPNVSVSDSISQPKVGITSLDLSKATNITAIEEESFKDSGLTSVNFGDSSKLETIGANAFNSNQISGELVIPNSVTTIGNSAFSDNQISSLTFVENSSLTTIEDSAFNSNQISGELVLPESLTVIGNKAFYRNQISSLAFPEGIIQIGDSAFQSNQIITLSIPSSLTTIESLAFYGNQISSLTIPKTLTSIGSSAFADNNFEQLTIEKCTADICNSNKLFGSSIKSLTVESGEIGENAFSSSSDSTTKLEKLTLGNGVTTIGDSAFHYNQISELTIPNSVSTIGAGAFAYNPISNLKIPKSLSFIGKNAFLNIVFENLIIEECNASVCKIGLYGTGINNLTIESGEIGERAFQSSYDSTTKIKKLTLGDGVTTIDGYAFYNNQISSLTFAENSSLTSIGQYAFDSNLIASLTLPDSLTTIGNDAFSRNKISSLTIPSSVTSIGEFVFYRNQISNLTIPNSVTTIGNYAFDSNQIASLTIPNSVTTIEKYAFNSNPLTTILIKRTKEDFLANVTVGSSWYSGTPTITYEPE